MGRSTPWLVLFTLYCVHGDLKEYVFDTSYFKINPDNNEEVWMQGINGQVPGPEIRVRNGDRLRVVLVNNCQTEQLTIHWHGFEMRAAQEYDGVYGVTMCAVEPGHTFVYEFDVNEVPGTYMYHEHAHIEHVAGRGFFGPLIVEEKVGEVGLWDNELANQACGSNCEAVLSIFDYWPVSQEEVDSRKVGRIVRPPMVSAQGNGVALLPFHNLLINGKGAFNIFGQHNHPNSSFVTDHTHVGDLFEIAPVQGQTWRLRLINMGALFAFRFRIDRHRLKVIATDGGDVEPFFCDAITMSAGERFDVLVTFDQTPGSYWMRAETLEDGFGIHHGQLAVLRYSGTARDVLPDRGYSIRDTISDHPSFVTLNCVDQAKMSSTCLPVTVLRRHSGLTFDHVGHVGDETHDFEVALRGFAGEINTHMTRLLDLKDGGNPYGENQFEGPYTQFAPPKVPYPYVNGIETHENTLVMRLSYGETVRVVLQWQDRAAHPWHMHGHKFAVLAFGFPDYNKDCDLIYCRSKSNHWLTRDGAIQANGEFTSFGRKMSDDDKVYSTDYPTLLDPDVAPLKDTLHLPAGGWAVIQFKADNPGWWFFHCHMLVHMADGMALIIEEARDQMPSRLLNTTYLDEKGFPSCSQYVAEYNEEGVGKSCNCWQNPEMKWDNWPRSNYRCTTDYLCGQELLFPLDPHESTRDTASPRGRDEQFSIRIALVVFWLCVVGLLFAIKSYHDHQHRRRHTFLIQEFVKETEHLASGMAGMLQGPLLHKVEPTKSGIHSAAYVAHSSKKLFESKEIQERQDQYMVDIEFVASKGHPSKNNAVQGTLAPGSLMIVMGKPENTRAWINFLGGKQTRLVRGNLKIGGKLLKQWNRCHLRQVVGYLPRTSAAARGNVYALEILNLYMRLGCSMHVYPESHERERYRDHLITIFHLHEHLSQRLSDLSPEALLRVNIAKELLLPRGLLVLEDPLESLQFCHAKKIMKMLQKVTDELKVAIIFSSEHCVAEVGKYATHGIVALQDFTAFGTTCELEAFCTFVSNSAKTVPARPLDTHVIEHCSYLIEKCVLDNLFVMSERGKGEAYARTRKKLNGNSTEKSKTKELGFDRSCTWNSNHEDKSTEEKPQIRFWTIEQVDAEDSSKCDIQGNPSAGTLPSVMKSGKTWERTDTVAGKNVASMLRTVKSVLEDVLPSMQMDSYASDDNAGLTETPSPPRLHRRIFVQAAVLTEFELLRGFKEYITVYKLIETLGVGVVACMVWWRKGSADTQTSLGEVVGLLFFTTAMWSLPPLFQALTAMPGILSLVSQEFLGGLYSLYAFIIANFIASAFTLCAIWPPLWQAVAYCGAEVGSGASAMVQMKVVVMLNVLTMRTMGLVLALVVPSQQTNVVIGNIVAQFCLLTNGFYTKLPEAFFWVTHFSIPRYTLRALLKLEFAWDDTFLVNPMTGNPNFGFPTMYIPAQLTGMFQTMHNRGMDIMQSYQDSDPLVEMLSLLGITLVFQFIFAIGLFLTMRESENDRRVYEEESFHVIGSWQELLDELMGIESSPKNLSGDSLNGSRNQPHTGSDDLITKEEVSAQSCSPRQQNASTTEI